MKIMKRTFAILFIALTCISSFSIGYGIRVPVYADSESGWQDCDTLELQTQAFIAYCKSRDLTLEGSFADGVTSATTMIYHDLLQGIGLDVDSIQADIKYSTDKNGGLQFLFNVTGAAAMNRVFGQFLQDHELAVGDDVDNKRIYEGYTFEDLDGFTCLCTSVPSFSATLNPSVILYNGTVYHDSHNTIVGSTFDANGYCIKGYNLRNEDTSSDVTLYINYRRQLNNTMYDYSYSSIFLNPNNPSTSFYRFDSNAYLTICVNSRGKFQLYVLSTDVNGNPQQLKRLYNYNLASGSQSQSCIIFVTTNNTVINNNDYSDNSHTVINNEGDVYNYNYDPDDPNDPVEPPVNPPDPPDDPPDLPDWDIELPDFNNIDWVMSGLEKKFPWDIPFNMMFMLSLFAHEPEAPHFEGDIDLKIYTWHYDLDLEPYEQLAEYFRLFFFLGFLLGLMLMTKQLIWG